jgi:transposase
MRPQTSRPDSGHYEVASDSGERAAAIYTLIEKAKLSGLNPEACLREVLARIADHPAFRLHELLPWHWKWIRDQDAAA